MNSEIECYGCTKADGLGNRRSIRLSYGTGLKYEPLTKRSKFL
jgi:hypothetical protein